MVCKFFRDKLKRYIENAILDCKHKEKSCVKTPGKAGECFQSEPSIQTEKVAEAKNYPGVPQRSI